jgi:hypothetical protein
MATSSESPPCPPRLPRSFHLCYVELDARTCHWPDTRLIYTYDPPWTDVLYDQSRHCAVILGSQVPNFSSAARCLSRLAKFTMIQMTTALSQNTAMLVVFRLFNGLMGRVGVENGGGSIVDMFELHERTISSRCICHRTALNTDAARYDRRLNHWESQLALDILDLTHCIRDGHSYLVLLSPINEQYNNPPTAEKRNVV